MNYRRLKKNDDGTETTVIENYKKPNPGYGTKPRKDSYPASRPERRAAKRLASAIGGREAYIRSGGTADSFKMPGAQGMW